ncbi:MAG TPA: hypothetical protein VFP72_14925, partial [Kineosporiaceae bacterium]|nr:hypothetical protein [Kineosporiaceae bacterium]
MDTTEPTTTEPTTNVSARTDSTPADGISPQAQEPRLRLPAGRRPVPTRSVPGTRKVPVVAYALTGLLLLGGVVGGSMALGWWQTDCGGVNETAVASGTLTPDGVKGSMTVQQVADGFPGLTTSDVLTFFAAPSGTPAS